MRRPLPWICALALAAGVGATPKYQFAEATGSRPRRLEYGTVLSRVRYQSRFETKDMYRAAGEADGVTQETETSRQFQTSVWEVPGGSGILRVETAPLTLSTQAGDQELAVRLGHMPLAVRYIRRDGTPCTYWGKLLPHRKSTALVFPDREVAPGDSWTRNVPASDEFQLPTEVKFTYLREGRVSGRLCAEVGAVATANGQLPDGSGIMTLKAEITYLFDIRLGRVLYSTSRMHQSMIGRGDKSPPAKRRIDELVETSADF